MRMADGVGCQSGHRALNELVKFRALGKAPRLFPLAGGLLPAWRVILMAAGELAFGIGSRGRARCRPGEGRFPMPDEYHPSLSDLADLMRRTRIRPDGRPDIVRLDELPPDEPPWRRLEDELLGLRDQLREMTRTVTALAREARELGRPARS